MREHKDWLHHLLLVNEVSPVIVYTVPSVISLITVALDCAAQRSSAPSLFLVVNAATCNTRQRGLSQVPLLRQDRPHVSPSKKVERAQYRWKMRQPRSTCSVASGYSAAASSPRLLSAACASCRLCKPQKKLGNRSNITEFLRLANRRRLQGNNRRSERHRLPATSSSSCTWQSGGASATEPLPSYRKDE